MSKHPEYQYLDLLTNLLEVGDERRDRTGVGRRALFGQQLRFDLADGFPLLTTKKVFYRPAWAEMLLFGEKLSTSRGIQSTQHHNIKLINGESPVMRVSEAPRSTHREQRYA